MRRGGRGGSGGGVHARERSGCIDGNLATCAALLQFEVQEENELLCVRRRIALGHGVLEHEEATFEPLGSHGKDLFHMELQSCCDLHTEQMGNIPRLWTLCFRH